MTNLIHSSFDKILVDHKEALQDIKPNYTDILRDPLLTSDKLLSSKELDQYLFTSHQAEQVAQSRSEESRKALSNNLSILLAHADGKAEELSQLPDQIETLEDELAELCSELKGDRGGSSSETNLPSTSLLQTLREKQTILEQLEETQDSLAILAKAEDLKDQAIKVERQDENSKHSLLHLTELAALSRRVESLSNGDTQSLKSIAFVNAQKSQTFTALAKTRQDRLDSALRNAGWPPQPPELKFDKESAQQAPDQILLKSKEVRTAWQELMILQRKSEQIGVLRPSSARIIAPSEDAAIFESLSQSSLPSPGSKSYQPLLTVESLLKPLLLRFYYHFDSSRTTNRLDKPEWYLNHMLSILRSHISLFEPIRGAIAVLCNNVSKPRKSLRYDLSAELLHGLLRPLTLKVESSIELLLKNSQLLSHTIMQTVQFDQDVRATLMPIQPNCSPIFLADALLSNEIVFEAWVQSERAFASDRLNEEVESRGAWLVGDEDGLEAEATEGSWSAMAQDGSSIGMTSEVEESNEGTGSIRIKTTRSARAVMSLIEGLTVRYKALPSVSHQLPFLLIQLSILQGYAQRLERSLDAFESLSSAFSRAIPGAISGGPNESQGMNGSEADMVRGLRGLGRLLKACLSALYVSAYLSAFSSQSFFLIMGTSLANTPEGEKLMGDFRKWEGDEEERELDQASLGDLVRRGWRSGGRLASGMRPLTANTPAERLNADFTDNVQKTSKGSAKNANAGLVDVWEKARERFDTLAQRALRGMEKMITSEVLEGMRTYSQRDWDQEEDNNTQEEDEKEAKRSIFDIPTPSLLSSLSTLSMHLSHMLPSLPRLQANTVYRTISDQLANAVVDRVVFSGGAHRFNLRGAQRFQQDVHHGWMGVVNDVAVKLVGANNTVSSPMGTRPQACWTYLLDTVKLLSLSDKEEGEEKEEAESPTLQQACRAAFEPTMAGPSWEQVMEMLNIDDRMNLRIAQEILRRRIECPW